MKLRLFVLCLFVPCAVFAQSVHNGNFQVLGTFDASTGLWSKPMTTAASDPTGACSNAAAMVLNTSTGAQGGDISACINGNWRITNNSSLTLTGDVTGTASGGSLAATVQKIGGVPLTNLSGLAKWTAGQPSSAAAADVVSLFGSGSCVGVLESDGSCLNLTLPLSVANGGNGTATPSLSAGANMTITGTWPNYTLSAAGGGGGGSSLAQFAPAYGSGTVTFGSCSAITPCYLAPNGIMDSFTATPVVSPGSGSAADTLWVYGVPGSNTIQVGYNSANTYTCSNCALNSGIQAIPANAYGLYSCTITAGQAISGGCTPTSTPYSNSSIGTGLGVAAVRNLSTGALTLNTDRVVRQVKTGTTDTLLATDCGGEVVYAVSGAMSTSLPQAGLGNQFTQGCDIWLVNKGTGTVTFTPAGSSHFNGVTGGQVLAAGSASGPTSAYLSSDGNDYWGSIMGPGSAGSLQTSGGTMTGPLTIMDSTTGSADAALVLEKSNPGFNTLMDFPNGAQTWRFIATGTGSGAPNNFSLFDVNTGTTVIGARPTTDIVTFGSGIIQLTTQLTPSSSASACSVGQIEADANFVYVCVATNSWKRATLSTF